MVSCDEDAYPKGEQRGEGPLFGVRRPDAKTLGRCDVPAFRHALPSLLSLFEQRVFEKPFEIKRFHTLFKNRGMGTRKGSTERLSSRSKHFRRRADSGSHGIRKILCSFNVRLLHSFCSSFRPPVPHRARNGNKHSSRDCSALWGYKSDSRNVS